MHVARFRPIIYLQLFLLLIDLVVNAFGVLFRANNVVSLVIFIIQDVALLLALIVLFLVFFSTFVFQAGLIFLLVRKFRAIILTTVIYLLLSVGLHIWTMTLKWGDEIKFIWTNGYQTLHIIQRASSIMYYFSYIGAMYRLADPRYYKDSEWLRKEFTRVH